MAGLVAPVDVPARHVADEEHHPQLNAAVQPAQLPYGQLGELVAAAVVGARVEGAAVGAAVDGAAVVGQDDET